MHPDVPLYAALWYTIHHKIRSLPTPFYTRQSLGILIVYTDEAEFSSSGSVLESRSMLSFEPEGLAYCRLLFLVRHSVFLC